MLREIHAVLLTKLPGDEQVDRPGSADIFLFEGFRFDRSGGCLFRTSGSDVAEPLRLGSRALALLGLLLEGQGQLVTKDEIFGVVWPGIAVEEANLTVQISALRRVLDRDRIQGGCIQTIPGRGYRFVVPVTRPEVHGNPDSPILAAGSPRSPPRLSIVVLPFTNLSDDREQQYFADGITDDLTTNLSRIAGMLVISRNTALTYRDKRIDTRQIGRELSVRYVLEGSVRRSGNKVRVNAQLIDAETDAHLWVERYDRDISDLFALQDEVTSQIAYALNLELALAEAARPTEHPDALDYIFRGRAVWDKPRGPGTYVEAISLYERALALDPGSVEAQSRLATALASRVLDELADFASLDIARADSWVRQALAASPRSPLAHIAKGMVLRAQRRNEEAILEFETVIAFDRNWASAYPELARCKFCIGSTKETIPLLEKAIRLSPRDGAIGYWYARIGAVHLVESRIDEAIAWLEKARSSLPALPPIRAHLASAYALKGDTDRASAELAEARRLGRDDRYSSIARLKVVSDFGLPTLRALSEATYFAGLRMAGMPEE